MRQRSGFIKSMAMAAFAVVAIFLMGRTALAQNADYITTVGNAGGTFVQHGTSTTFTPFGYDDGCDVNGVGYWWNQLATVYPSTWLTLLSAQYSALKAEGCNTIRIWIPLAYLVDAPSSGNPYGTPDATGEANLVSLVNMVNGLGMRLDIGCGGYLDPYTPWYLAETPAEQLDTNAVLDGVIAQTAGGASGSNAILCYEVTSEQGIGDTDGSGTLTSSGATVTGKSTTFTTTFQVGSTFTVSGTTYTVHTITSNTSMTLTTTPSPKFSKSSYNLTIATWVADYMIQMDAAIHAYDTAHLIQAGLVQCPTLPPGYWPETAADYAPYVNFLSIHDYPNQYNNPLPGTLSSSGATVTGTGTTFTTSFVSGSTFLAAGTTYTVGTITSNTSMTVSPTPSPAFSGSTYTQGVVQSAIVDLNALTGLGPAYGFPVMVEETAIIWCSFNEESQFMAQAMPANGGKAAGLISSTGNLPISTYLAILAEFGASDSISISGASDTTPIEITTTTPIVNAPMSVDISGVLGNTAANSGPLTVISAEDAQPIAITGATDATPIVITAASNGYFNGETVKVSGVQGNTTANGTWVVSGCTTNTFQLVNSEGNGTYVSNTGTTTPPILAEVSGGNSYLTSGATVTISGATGSVSPYNLNGTYTITEIPGYPMCFTLNGSTPNGTYTSGGTVTWNWGTTIVDSTHFTLNNSVGSGTYTSGGTAALPFGNYLGDDFSIAMHEIMISPQDLGFEDSPQTAATPNNYAYGGNAVAWTFSPLSGNNGSGVSGNGSSLTSGNPNAPQGTQVAFVQGGSSAPATISQNFYFVNGTSYTISFDAAQMATQPSGSPEEFTVDIAGGTFGSGTVLTGGSGGSSGDIQPSGSTYQSMSTGSFTIGTNPTGWYTISFNGITSTNSFAFIDGVSITP